MDGSAPDEKKLALDFDMVNNDLERTDSAE